MSNSSQDELSRLDEGGAAGDDIVLTADRLTATNVATRGTISTSYDVSVGGGSPGRRPFGLRLRSPLFHANQTVLLQDETIPSWLELPCELPTDLFHTLTPITSSRMLGRSFMAQSTPYDREVSAVDSLLGIERSEPMGGENPETVPTRAIVNIPVMAQNEPYADDHDTANEDTRSQGNAISEEIEVAFTRPRPPLVGEAAASTDAATMVKTVVSSSRESQIDVRQIHRKHDPAALEAERDPLAARVAALLKNVEVSNSVAVQTSHSFRGALRKTSKVIKVRKDGASRKQYIETHSVGVQTSSSFLTSLRKSNTRGTSTSASGFTPPETPPNVQEHASHSDYQNLQRDTSTDHTIQPQERQKRATKPKKVVAVEPPSDTDEGLRDGHRSWFIPFESKGKSSKRAEFKVPSSQQRIAASAASSSKRGQATEKITDETLSLQDAFKLRCAHMMKRSQRRAQYINARTRIRKLTAERRFAAIIHLYQTKLADELSKPEPRTVRTDPPSYLYSSVCGDQGGSQSFKMKRIFTHKEMRMQTERIYQQLPEVLDKVRQKKKAEEERTYRLMSQLYTHKVKQNMLKGKTDFPITKNMIVF